MKSLVGIASLAIVCVLQFTVDAQAGSRRRCCCCCPPANGAAAAAAAGAAVTPAAPAAAAGTLRGPINPALADGTALGGTPTGGTGGGGTGTLRGPINPDLANGITLGSTNQTTGTVANVLLNPSDTSQTETWNNIAQLQKNLSTHVVGLRVYDLRKATLQNGSTVPVVAASDESAVLSTISTDWSLP